MRKNGFYVYRSNIYYGCYEEEQVSGRWKISEIKPERILTGHPVGEEDWAVRHILPTDMVRRRAERVCITKACCRYVTICESDIAGSCCGLQKE